VKIVETNAFMWLIRCMLNALGNFFDFFTLRNYKGTPCNDSIKMKFPERICFQEKKLIMP
jgi:hypothetical protein